MTYLITDGQPLKEIVEPREGEDLKMIVVFVATGDQRYEIDLTTLHSKPRTGSDLILRGVVFDKASVTFKGLIDIRKGAKQSKAFLRADALLLGDQAKADLIPSLTIKENEVRAGHGATVGRINDDQLFYLMSRGLTRANAVLLLVRGFLHSVTDDLLKTEQLKIEQALHQVFVRS